MLDTAPKQKSPPPHHSQQVDLLICIQGKAHFHTDAYFSAEEAPPSPNTTQHNTPFQQTNTAQTSHPSLLENASLCISVYLPIYFPVINYPFKQHHFKHWNITALKDDKASERAYSVL